MDTLILKIDTPKGNESKIEAAAKIIKSGGLVAFPTETVYGLGADAYNSESIKNIYKAKGRPSDNPLILHISNFDMMNDLCDYLPENAKILMDTFMPGPITIIVPKSDKVPDVVTAGLKTVAVRFPSDKVASSLIEAANVPIAAPSANLSGKPSPTTFRHVFDDLNGRVDCIIEGCDCECGVESTVVDATGDVPVILRPGIITPADIKEVIPSVIVDKNVLEAVSIDETPKCPGMKYKHYSPDADVYVVEGDSKSVKKEIDRLISENSDKTIGVMTCSDNTYEAEILINVGSTFDKYAHSLYTSLRKFDELGADIVFAEFSEGEGAALAVKNRLYKSAGHKVIHV